MQITGHTEKKSEYYDNIYAAGYDTLRYQPIYRGILEYLRQLESPRVLEIGCGVGDMGKMIVDNNIPYRGFDFSAMAIKCSREICPEGNFWVGDAYNRANYLPPDYNVAIAFEVLEHTDDLRVIENIPAGVHLVASVPDFDDIAHLRVYQDPQRDIVERFRPYLDVGHIFPAVLENKDTGYKATIFVVHAVRKAAAPIVNVGLPTHQPAGTETMVAKIESKISRNAPCPCGSGRKHKKCCGRRLMPA